MKRNHIAVCMLSLVALVSSCVEEIPHADVPSIATDNVIFSGGTVEEVVLTRGGDAGERTVTERTIASENGEVVLPLTVEVIKGIHRSEGPATRAAITTDPNAITELDAWCIYTKYTDATQSAISTRELYFDDMTNPDEGAPFEKAADGIFYPAEGYGPYLWRGLEPASMFNFYNVSPVGSGFNANINLLNNAVTFDYTVPARAAAQKDILVASPAPVATNYNQPVPLTFKHVMAAVNVKVGTVPSGTITSVKFTGVYDKGSYFPDSEEWTNRSISTGETEAKGVFEVALPADGVAVGAGSNGTSLTTAETSFMMIPQQLASGAEIVVGFTDGTTNKTYTLRAGIGSDVWGMNTTTNYIISIDPNYNLTIVPLDKTLDSHYIITKVEISSEFPIWKLTVKASDNADVTVELEENLNPMAKLGFWTDKISRAKDSNGNYILSEDSARGSYITAGTQTTSQIVSVFIPENISGSTREITLTLEGGNSLNALTSKKELVLTQDSVKWLQDPFRTGDTDTYWGCELIIENGQVPWGFCFEDLNEDWRAYGKVDNQPPGWWSKITDAMKAAGLDLDYLMSGEGAIQIITRDDHKSTYLLRIDWGELGKIDVAEDYNDGAQNTYDLYKFDGINVISSIKDFLIASSQAGNKGLEHVPGTFDGQVDKTLDYAAMYAMKRNRFHLYEEMVNTDAGDILMTIPIIEDKDINWYLPAKDQFPCFMNTNWGQAFTFNDLYWTSTAYITETDNAHAYAYLNGNEVIAHRNDPYLTFALRRHTMTGNVQIPINPGDVVQPGGDIEVNPPGGDDNTGGDIVKP